MVQKLIEDVSFMAHGYCLLWDPRLLMLHAASDLVIAVCYFAIPLGIWYYLRLRPDLELKGLAWLFVAFIFLCGLTHVIGMVTLWSPIYVTQGTVKFLTAGASLVTAASLVKVMPKALAIPSPAQLQSVNQDLIAEIEAHRLTLKELSEAKSTLEHRVALRTRELESAKSQFQHLFEQSPAAMLMTDDVGKIKRTNVAASDLFRIQKTEANTSSLEKFLPDLDFEQQKAIHNAEKNLQDEVPSPAGKTFTAVKEDGTPFPAEIRTNTVSVGENDYFIVSVFDVSEREDRQNKIELLMAEVNHRANNLLAVVQTISRQTARESSGEDFADTLLKRLQSLSTSQDLIIRGNWTRVDISALVNRQLAFLGEIASQRCSLNGPMLDVTPQAAQGIGMAIHELATNSIKYGALSNDKGRVEISWKSTKDGEKPSFEIVWKERDGPRVEAPSRRGFGNIVIERMAAASVNGDVTLTYNPDGVVWQLVAPLDISIVA